MASVLLRRGWVVVLATVAVAALALLISSARTSTYSADATFIVGSGASSTGPGSANEAVRLATTYAQLIPHDDAVLAGASRRLGLAPVELEDHLEVLTVPETSLLKVRYVADSADTALRGATAVAQTIQTAPDVAATIPRGSLIPSDLPTTRDVVERGGSRSASTLPVGLLLGFALGIVLALAWERSDRRVDRGDDLTVAAGTPSLVVDDLAGPAAQVLLRRWAATPPSRPAVVALVAVGAAGSEPSRLAARRLQALAGDLVVVARTSTELLDADDVRAADVVLVPAGAPGGREDGEAAASVADVVVLVARRGSPAAAVSRAVEALARYDLTVSWALLVGRRAGRGSGDAGGARTPDDEAPEDPRSQARDPALSTPGGARGRAGSSPHG